jgi:hypothetical protein
MFSKLREFLSDAFDGSCFVIRIASGELRVSKGHVPAGFLGELREVIGAEKLERGVIRGERRETYVRLGFSREIPEALHQRLRNLWHVHEPNFQTDGP